MILRQVLRYGASACISRQSRRNSSILTAINHNPVLVSSNKDIYTNLALEHWLYSSLNFGQNQEYNENEIRSFSHPIVLIWTDEPCLVIGRHQNPWVETNVGLAHKLGIKMARRHSGGGCVYHDENNINISIIGDRKLFENRQANLKILAGFLEKRYGIKCEPNKRHDLIHSETGLKMSGSAAKLGRVNSYHHFTLLVDSDKDIMRASIRQKQQDFIQTNSSLSNRSSVINLAELKSNLTVDKVVADLVQEYGLHYKDASREQESRCSKVQGDSDDVNDMSKIRNQLTSWEWIFGMTPKFKLERTISLLHEGDDMRATFRIHVEKGAFRKFEVESDQSEINEYASKFNGLIGTKFDYKEAMVAVVRTIDSGAVVGNEQLFATHLLQMIHEAHF